MQIKNRRLNPIIKEKKLSQHGLKINYLSYTLSKSKIIIYSNNTNDNQ